MTAGRKDEEQIFHAAIAKPISERMNYLKVACGSDPDLLAHMRALLRAYDIRDDFLEVPPTGAEVAFDQSPLNEKPGTVIGRYKLLERIGEGGMAVVYMAEQERPIRRKVALKIIKLGMDTKQVIARFEAERQALAMMDHPNIAKVFDAGATETGRPYFVMELVRGVSITAYCDQEKLCPRERLELFAKVCSAVQHAHQRGIIHRDLKPSNVMVTMHDDEAVPKIIDFGIAKATNQRLTEKTLFTRYAQIVGTPAYMSPEQAQMSDLDIDTRSDIYSLGVLLYELLTGTAPFAEEELRRAGYAEMQRIICEEEPTKPSTKLSTLGETLTEIARQRCATPESLRKTVRGDLDWIVMKSLEKNRIRRYETASAFKRDIQRYLQHEPVHAHRPSAVYRLQKYLYRHRVHAIAVLAAVVLLGAMISLIYMVNTQRERQAEIERAEHDKALSAVRDAWAQGDRQIALDQVKELLPSPYVGPEARLLYAGILVDAGHIELADEILEELFEERSEIAGAAHALMVQLLLKHQSLDIDRDLELIEFHKQQAQTLLPNTAEAHFLQATTALTIRERQAAIKQTLRRDPGHYDAWRLQAYTHYASRKYQDMRVDARVMTVSRPQDPLGHALHAAALWKLGQLHAALEETNDAIDLCPAGDPQRIDLYDQSCRIYLDLREFDHALATARAGLRLFPDTVVLLARSFCALTALGQYERATTLFQQTAKQGRDSHSQFRHYLAKYVFNTLKAGRSWYPQSTPPEGMAYVGMHEAEATYKQLRSKGCRFLTEGFSGSWSPDGTKMVLSLGVPGDSSIATFDPNSGEIDLLAAPGKEPRWSPDGQHIAFVRELLILDQADPSQANYRYETRAFVPEFIWIIRPDGTEPQRLLQGNRPFWSQDSKHIYYNFFGQLRTVSIEDKGPATQHETITEKRGFFPSVSPDGKLVARVENGNLKILDVTSKSQVHDAGTPPNVVCGQWTPHGNQLVLTGRNDPENRAGLWIYDLDFRQLTKLLSGPITDAAWPQNDGQFVFSLGPPLNEIWTVDIDPEVSVVEALGPGQGLKEHYEEMVDYFTLMIEAEPANALNYLGRAQCHDFLGNSEQVLVDMDQYLSVINPGVTTSAFDLWFRDLLMDLWAGTPVNLGPTVNTPQHDAGSISLDGRSLVMDSNRAGGQGSFDNWMATRSSTAEPWSAPKNLGAPVNTQDWDGMSALSDDNLTLWFTSNRPGSEGYDIWVSTRATTKSSWGAPTNLGPTVNTAHWECANSVTADGLELYISSDRPGLHGNDNWDIWVSKRATTQDGWNAPVNLGATVNSPAVEFNSTISPDGLILFITSERPGGIGGRDIWVTTRPSRDTPWREPINLGPPINTLGWDQGATFSTADSMLYFNSWRSDGYGGLDVWRMPIPNLSDYLSGSNN